jgi:Kef-type K+ transport system membrane component KefB
VRIAIMPDAPHNPLIIFMGVVFSTTAFSVLAHILTELKLLTTDLAAWRNTTHTRAHDLCSHVVV